MTAASPSFLDRLAAAQRHAGTVLCVGLDPDLDRMAAPWAEPLSAFAALNGFCQALVRATAHVACAYKPNMAFFEAHGLPGLAALTEVTEAIRRLAPHALVVLDGKRGDIGNTARMYAASAFGPFGADALTVSPYMGRDAVQPFLEHAGRAAFVLARTSNPGAADVQERAVEGEALYRHVVRGALGWAEGQTGTLGFVAGATDLGALADVRALAPEAPLLVPGVGAQGGDAAAVLRANAGGPVLVNVGRDVLYAPDPRAAAERFAARLPASPPSPTPPTL